MAPPFKVLAIDGGGIRGIIPALILVAIEERTKRPISDLFDMLSGTSTGGIIALGLAKPDANGKPEKSARDIVGLYETEGDSIFPRSLRAALHLEALAGSRYPADGIESTLERYFGEVALKDALKPLLVPSYDVEKQLPIFFKSEKARASAEYDFPMRQVARDVGRAYVLSHPEKITTADPLQYFALIDGGLIANNPAMCAYAEAIKMGRAGDGVLVVSIGTGDLRHPLKYDDCNRWGQLEWAQPVLDVALQGSSETVDYQLQQLLNASGPNQSYYRFQLSLTADAQEMDNATDANIKHLMDLADDFLNDPDTKESLDELCARLTT